MFILFCIQINNNAVSFELAVATTVALVPIMVTVTSFAWSALKVRGRGDDERRTRWDTGSIRYSKTVLKFAAEDCEGFVLECLPLLYETKKTNSTLTGSENVTRTVGRNFRAISISSPLLHTPSLLNTGAVPVATDISLCVAQVSIDKRPVCWICDGLAQPKCGMEADHVTNKKKGLLWACTQNSVSELYKDLKKLTGKYVKLQHCCNGRKLFERAEFALQGNLKIF
uniref:Uncharacterized protein n=1 Tax=Glossina pallidipes TaxID=7398 RepID=A0A1A9ZYU4_GLOPL